MLGRRIAESYDPKELSVPAHDGFSLERSGQRTVVRIPDRVVTRRLLNT